MADTRPDLPAVLITGGAVRLGAAIARRFAEAGWHVVIHYRDSADEAERLAATLPSARCVSFDLADGAAIAGAVASLAADLADWRALVNCAALFELDDAACIDPGTFERAMTANARGPVVLAQSYLATARSTAGRRVINVLDQKLANLNPDFFSYTMAKAALAAATEMLAMAHHDTRDRVYGLSPGAMLPSHDQRSEEHEVSGRLNLLSRLTDPAELADAALLLAEGHLKTGQTLFVDSGQHLLQQDRDVLYLARRTGR